MEVQAPEVEAPLAAVEEAVTPQREGGAWRPEDTVPLGSIGKASLNNKFASLSRLVVNSPDVAGRGFRPRTGQGIASPGE